jgi:outer membrane protein assembly factor BamB
MRPAPISARNNFHCRVWPELCAEEIDSPRREYTPRMACSPAMKWTFGLVIIFGAGVLAQDYAQWRGPGRDGTVSFAEPRAWPESLTRRWRVEAGDGYSTPLLVGDTLYVFTRRDGSEVLTSLDAATGVERWRSGYPAPFTPSKPAAAHGPGPKATPVFHAGKVFTLGISGIVAAFDSDTGTLLWRTDPPVEPPFFSAAASPVADGSLVMTHPGNYGPLTAFDAESGQVKWTAGHGGFFQAPLVAVLDGVRQVVTVTQSSVAGISLPDGQLLWEFGYPGATGGTMPVLFGDSIVVSALDKGTTAIRPARQDGKWTVSQAWHTTDVSMYISNPVIIGDTLVGLSRRASGQLFSLDARSGRVLWLGPPREAENIAFAKSGDLLFMLKDTAELIIARTTPQAIVKRYTVADAPTWAQPVISRNRIFVKDVNGVTLWTVD